MDLKYFDITRISTIKPDTLLIPAKCDKSGAMASEFLNVHFEKIESLKRMKQGFPKEGTTFYLWTINSFNAFTFIPHIITHAGFIEELIISTYSINIRIINALTLLIDKKMIADVKIFISDSIKTRNQKVYDNLISVCEKYPIEITYSWNHSKITLMKTADDFFIVEGSGNFGENAQFEQYVFNNSKSIFEFRKNSIIYELDRRTV